MQSSFIHPIKPAFPLKLDRANTDVDEQGPKFKQQTLTRRGEHNSSFWGFQITCGRSEQHPWTTTTEKLVSLQIQVLTQSGVCRSRRQSAGIYWRPTPSQARCHADTAAILFEADTLIMMIIWVRRCLKISKASTPHPTWHTSQRSCALSKDPQGHERCRPCAISDPFLVALP